MSGTLEPSDTAVFGMERIWFFRDYYHWCCHRCKLLEMQSAFSNNHISPSMNFWYLSGIGYGFGTIGGPVVGISISNRLVLPTSIEDLDIMLSDSFSSKEECLSLASCGMCTSCNITNCLFELLHSSWKLDSGGMVQSSVGLFLILSFDFSVLVYDALLTSVLSISVGFNVPTPNCSRNSTIQCYIWVYLMPLGIHS